MDLYIVKPSICVLGDHIDLILPKLQTFEGGLPQFQFIKEITIKKSQNKQCGVFKLSWLNKLRQFPPTILYIQDLAEQDKFDKIVENYAQIREMGNLSKKFQSRIIVLYTGKNIYSLDFTQARKDIDFKRVMIVELESVGTILKKLKKSIYEDTIGFYEELYNKCKADSQKLQKNEYSDLQLTLEIKKTLISEVVNNQKRAAKHLLAAYDQVIVIANQRREALQIDEDHQLYLSYELILQVEEYREIADQLKLKIFPTLELAEMCAQFEIHYRSLKNLIPHKKLHFQEYLWRVRIFTSFIKQIETKISYVSYNQVYNYFQATLLNYLHLQHIYKLSEGDQSQYEIKDCPREFVGRVNYQIYQNGQALEIRTEQKTQLYQHIIAHRRIEVEQTASVLFIFRLWDKYTEQDQQQYQYAIAYMNYMKAFITCDFEVRSSLITQLAKFGLWDEFKHLTESELLYAPTATKQIALNFELLLQDPHRLDQIIKLADSLDTLLECTIPSNNIAIIYTSQLSYVTELECTISIKLSQQLLSFITNIQLTTNDVTTELEINDTILFKSKRHLVQPIVIAVIGRYKNKLLFTFTQQETTIMHNDNITDSIRITQQEAAQISFGRQTANINEVNQIPISLTYEDTIQLLNPCTDQTKLAIFNNDKDTITCKDGVLLVSDTKEHQRVFQFKVGDDTQLLYLNFIFPFEFTIKVKQLDTVYKNAQNRHRGTVTEHSKCALQLQVKGVRIINVVFTPLVELQFHNVNSQNVIFLTKDPHHYKQFGLFEVSYQRGDSKNTVTVPVNEINVVSYAQDVQIISPPQCTFSVPFDITIVVNSIEPLHYFIQLKDDSKKQFFVMGMVKQSALIDGQGVFHFKLFPIEFGRCNLPGIIVEVRQPGNPNQQVFDSTGLKSIHVMP